MSIVALVKVLLFALAALCLVKSITGLYEIIHFVLCNRKINLERPVRKLRR